MKKPEISNSMTPRRHLLLKLWRTALLTAALPAFGAVTQSARASAPQPGALFGNGAVLQRDKPIPVWGTAEPGTEIRVKFRAQSATAHTDAEGKWSVKLKPETAGGPDPLTIEGKDASCTVKDVLVGEVWLASGQSNMVFTLKANPVPADPALRVFNVPQRPADAPAQSMGGKWSAVTPYTSAVAYFFGRKLREQLKIPVGVVISSVGGTAISSWISEEGAGSVPAVRTKLVTEWQAYVAGYPAAQKTYEESLAAWNEHKKQAESAGMTFKERKPEAPIPPNTPRRPFCLFNGMIHPVAPYALRGVLWYQGESDSASERAPVYESMLRAMIDDWRTRWAQPELPFLIVQLPIFHEDNWVLIRAAQEAVSREPGNGMIVTLDVGEKTNIHPVNKQPVGERLANLAAADVYGLKIPAHSPAPGTAKLENGAVRIAFACDDGASLVCKSEGASSGVELAGADGHFFPAQARTEENSLLVSCPEVPKPEQVRYAWAGAPAVTIFDSNGLPTSPFLLKVNR